MYNENKVKQVINAIKENRLSAMDDETLARLLSILSPKEFEILEVFAYEELGGLSSLYRIMNIKPLVHLLVDKELYRIKHSQHYSMYLQSLKNGHYLELITSLSIEELGDLKKYIYYNVNEKNVCQKSGAEKIIKIITKEIAKRDTMKKPRFE